VSGTRDTQRALRKVFFFSLSSIYMLKCVLSSSFSLLFVLCKTPLIFSFVYNFSPFFSFYFLIFINTFLFSCFVSHFFVFSLILFLSFFFGVLSRFLFSLCSYRLWRVHFSIYISGLSNPTLCFFNLLLLFGLCDFSAALRVYIYIYI